MKDDTYKKIIVFSLVGTAVLIIGFFAARFIIYKYEKGFDPDVRFVYNYITRKHKNDVKSNVDNSFKYISNILTKDNNDMKYIAEFNQDTNKLIHLCISDGNKMVDLHNEDINKKYIREYGIFVSSTDECKFD